MNPIKILIAVPISPYEKIEPNLVKWLFRNIIHFNYEDPGKINLSYDLVEGKPIDSVRNNIMNKFLKTDNDYILTIDSDIVPEDNCINTLLAWNVPIVGATCFSFQYGRPFPVILSKVNGGYTETKLNGNRLQKCEATGAACVLIKREVIENMKKDLLEKTGKTMFYETKYNPQGEIGWGQDFMFCENAMSIGYKIYVDTGIICGHYVSRLDIKRVNDLLVMEQRKAEEKHQQFKAIAEVENDGSSNSANK